MSRILLIVVNDPRYFLSHRLPIAKAAQGKGYEVHVASIASPLSGKVVEEGFIYHTIKLERGGTNPFLEFFAMISFVRLLWRLRPTLLHLVTTKPVLYGGMAARLAPVGGVVSAIAGMGSVFIGRDLRSKVLSFVLRRMYRLALGTHNLRAIFQNPCDRALVMKMSGLDADKAVLIRGSGVHLASYPVLPEPIGTITVTFAGRFLRDKGVHEFIKAAQLVKRRQNDVIFQLVGDVDEGNPTSLSGAEVEALTVEGNVRVLGYQSDLAKIFSRSHIVVLPSYREGLPKVLIEAAACARPVVTSDVPGCRDAIIAGETGLLVPVKDAEALAIAIEKLVSNAELRHDMGRAGRKWAEREFAIENVVKVHLDVYQTLEAES
ncbi:glycosyltransferase family 4 protein [Pseudomonas sp. SWRI12]|uniref:Glycosyltransferase family 4 protein n=1 Tax=Pseudomonas zanjanensis TaxID=2745496 RepID=A0A923F9L0_9PSED|nr:MULTISPECIES: glycosyltransferase family 4 protein [Pseudomonas]MBC3383350.1 glycosyltransferase family 4 protein [Pseudomonas sp. SWRI179]MBV4494398.1 glycosyltransferase family 4 protein [Pseudomonas zanjanensis]